MDKYNRKERFKVTKPFCEPQTVYRITMGEILKYCEDYERDIICPNCGIKWHMWCESPMSEYVFVNENKIANHYWLDGLSGVWEKGDEEVPELIQKESTITVYICNCKAPIMVHIRAFSKDKEYFNYEIESEQMTMAFEDK